MGYALFIAMHSTKNSQNWEIDFYERILKRNPSDVTVVELLGCLYSRKGLLAEGLKMDRRLVRLMPDNPTAHYNLACSLALKRRKADAVKELQKALQLGYSDVDWMREDPDLESLRGYPGYEQLLSQVFEG